MIEVEFVIMILVLEVITVIVLLVSLTLRKIWEYFNDRWEERSREKLVETLTRCLLENKVIKSCKRMRSFQALSLLLSVLEEFERKFSGKNWNKLKASIFSSCLAGRARKYASSRFWKKRNFSARCFALSPFLRDMEIILKLMDDPVFIVRGIVATAAVTHENKEGIYKIIKQMSRSNGYAYHFYRDLLIKGSQRVFQWIEEFAAIETDTDFHLACLDVFEAVYFRLTKLDIKKDLNSKDERVHLAALNLLLHNPQPYSMKVISHEMSDQNSHFRSEATMGLEHFLTSKSLRRLRGALKDSDTKVRMSAAATLKKSGDKGLRILRDQNPRMDKKAYEAAQFALKFL